MIVTGDGQFAVFEIKDNFIAIVWLLHCWTKAMALKNIEAWPDRASGAT